MKRHSCKVMVLVFISLISLTGCQNGKSGSLKIEKGILSWAKESKAEYYEVDFGGGGIRVDDTAVSLSDQIQYEGDYSVSVSSVESGKKRGIGSVGVSTVQLSEPSIVIKTDNAGIHYFSWPTDKNVSGYLYDTFDGKGKRAAKPGADGLCRVDIDGINKTLISVTAQGSSSNQLIYLSSTSCYQYENDRIFNLAELSAHRYIYASKGTPLDKLKIGTTLPKGTYNLEVTLYIMNQNGRQVSGNGLWGRRIVDNKSNIWFCDSALEGYPNSANTIPFPDQAVVKTLNLNVDSSGTSTVNVYDFKNGEMVVFADVKYNGKSVLSNTIKETQATQKFDVSKLSSYAAVYKGTGLFYDESKRKAFEINLPVKAEDGMYTVSFDYYLMTTDGDALTGNGIWGRRLSDTRMSSIVWFNEFDIAGTSQKGRDWGSPTVSQKATFYVEVKNNSFQLLCLDFGQGEMIVFNNIKLDSEKSRRFDISTLASYKNVFKSSKRSDFSSEQFKVQTTKQERGQFELQITFYAMDSKGYKLSGNGLWGRRMIDEGKEEHWLCNTMVRKDQPESEATVPEPDNPVTKTFLVTLNKYGAFTLEMFDFMEGETVVISDIKYNGLSIMAK